MVKVGNIKFGTDGWRAVISDDFTFDNVKVVAQAISDFLHQEYKREKKIRIAVGYDTRFMSEKYAELSSRVFVANDIDVTLTDRPTPTPAVTYAIKNKKLTGGVMITASHNPPYYNGIKYKAYYAGSADPVIIGKIENKLFKNKVKIVSIGEMEKNKSFRYENVCPSHLKFLSSYLDWETLKKKSFRILVDDMHGAAGNFIEKLLSKTGNKVVTIRSARDAYFGGINPEPVADNLKMLMKKVKEGRFDIGIATDGDVDRVAIVGPDGKLLTGHKVIALLLLHLLEDRKMKGEVVQTICGTILIDKICKKYGLKMHETPVGFKYICDIMRSGDVLIGGEEAGGIGFKNYMPERDGILSGLLILEMMAHRNKPLLKILESIKKEYGSFYYRRVDTDYPDKLKQKLMKRLKENPPDKILGKKVIGIKTFDGVKLILDDKSWLLLRLSGTEPILRIYSEAETDAAALRMLAAGKKIAFSIK
ncbi:MAG: phosphoglucomutase/phosphomannomutase family protein [Candidatus Omnitrophota bacterium]|nr:phosphoglucomutase/phosphomannomutase family protein [Candidatus Omnitrophota bacterium]